VQQPAFVLAGRGIAHLDLDETVAAGQRQCRPEQVAGHVVPPRADADRDGQREPAGDRQPRILEQHPSAEFDVQP
jgi:hypothetical protein